jgi:hypothetical protein
MPWDTIGIVAVVVVLFGLALWLLPRVARGGG